MIDHTGPHSFAIFKGTEDCPRSKSLDECVDGCFHARECFAKFDDPDEALHALMDEYCDFCPYADMEED